MSDKENSIQEIIESDVLFIVAVYSNIIRSGRWVKIGKAELKVTKLPLAVYSGYT